jgi:hypothetical protein
MYRRTLLSLCCPLLSLCCPWGGVRACIRCVCVCALPRLPMSFPCVCISCSPVSDVRAHSLSRVRVRARSCRQHVAESPATADVFVVQQQKRKSVCWCMRCAWEQTICVCMCERCVCACMRCSTAAQPFPRPSHTHTHTRLLRAHAASAAITWENNLNIVQDTENDGSKEGI